MVIVGNSLLFLKMYLIIPLKLYGMMRPSLTMTAKHPKLCILELSIQNESQTKSPRLLSKEPDLMIW